MRVRVVGVLAVAVGALTGCGGGDGQPLSKADFVRQANALCLRSNQRQNEIEKPKDVKGLVAAVEPARDDLRKTVDELGDLVPPKESKADFNALLGTLRDAEGQFDPLLAAAKKQDIKGVAAVVPKINALNTKADTLSKQLGLTTCAQG